jgi:F-type H+-transporting ATPase subunit a
MNAHTVNLAFIYNIFIEIKVISLFLIKMMISILLFLILNYNSYIYFRVGLTMHYGYVFTYALTLILFLWVLWRANNILNIVAHFLPIGIEGILKLFIPILEIIGVIIRPLTLAVRLATNIRCGHVVLLIFSYFAFNIATYLVLSIRFLLLGLYFIEFLVCAIQAYVFWSLLYIYLIEIEI